MSRRARNRAAAAALVAFVAGVVLAYGQLSGTFALFTAETENQSSAFAGGWVNAPTSLTVVPWGYGGSFAWTVGNHGPITSQQLYGADQNTTNSCTGAAYAAIGSSLGAAATTTTDGESSGKNAHYFCYRMRDLVNSWYAEADFTPNPILVGLVPTSISTCGSGCGSAANQIDPGDTITINYNQSVSYSGGSVILCVYTDGTIVIGDTSIPSNSTSNNNCNGSGSDSASIGKLTGLSVNAVRLYSSSSVTASGSSLKVTVGAAGGNGSGVRTGVTGTGTYAGAGTSVTSANGSPLANQCTTATTCTPSATVGF